MIKFVRVIDPVNIVFRFEKEPPKHCICDCGNEGMWIYVIKNAITIHEKICIFQISWNGEKANGSLILKISLTRTTRTPAFWGYSRRLMITHTIASYWIPSQKKTKSKLQI